jgi:DNA-binding LytR/AlgR family response regulator
MDKIKILIIEDELIVAEEIKELLVAQGYEVIGVADRSERAKDIVEKQKPDLVIADINIKGDVDGITLAEEFIEMFKPAIIFLTAYYDKEFIDRAKKVKPAAYLVKPFEAKNLLTALEIAISNRSDSPTSEDKSDTYKVNDGIFIKEQHKFVKVSLNIILYVEAVGSYIDIHTEKGKITLAINLKNFEERLADQRFFRIHRSFLVNLDKIEELSGNTIYINQKPIPVSGPHREEFMKRYKFI